MYLEHLLGPGSRCKARWSTRCHVQARKYLQRPENQRCRPINSDSITWTSDHWDPGIVVYPFSPCRLEVLGSPKLVRRSTIPTSDLKQRTKWVKTPLGRLDKHTFLIEAANGVPGNQLSECQIVAIGFLDMAGDGPQTLWAMCLYTEEGLLLERNADGTFSRLGVFAVEDEDFFEGLNLVPTTLV